MQPARKFECSRAAIQGADMATAGVLATLRTGWDAVAALGVPQAVVGGLALSAWNHARYTRDADILVAIRPEEVGRIVAALVKAGMSPRHSPPLRVIDTQGIAQFTFQPPGALAPFQFDILLAGTSFQREAIARAVERGLPDGGSVRVLQPDDLIIVKLLAGRIIDRADAAMLLRENRADIDFDRLRDEIARHGLSADYGQIWQEAFPGEQPR